MLRLSAFALPLFIVQRPVSAQVAKRQRPFFGLRRTLYEVDPCIVVFQKYTIMKHLSMKTSAELVQYALEHGMFKKHS
jgi:hypothetical protein